MTDPVGRNFNGDPESQKLLQSLARRGVTADGAVPAFAGVYPFFGGQTNVGLLLTRQRALSFHPGAMRSWVLHSGSQITRPLHTYPLATVVITDGRGSYCRLLTESGSKFWVNESWFHSISNLPNGEYIRPSCTAEAQRQDSRRARTAARGLFVVTSSRSVNRFEDGSRVWAWR